MATYGNLTHMQQPGPRGIANVPGQGQDTSTLRQSRGLPGQYQNHEAQNRLRTGGPGYQAFSEYAMSAPGETPWQKMMMERQGTEESGARDLAQSQAAGAGQSAWARMAMRGGGSRGSRERVLGGADNFGAMQNVARQGEQARADIGLRGEEQRLSMLGQLPGMEFQREAGAEGMKQQAYDNALKRFALMKKDWASRKMGEELLED